MQLVGLFCVLVVVVRAAPLTPGESPAEAMVAVPHQFYREKRSSYAPYYAPAPCGAAPAYIAPVHHAAYAPHYGYAAPSLPHYRNVEDQEMMSFSDMDAMPQQMLADHMMAEHVPLARYAYGAPALPVSSPHYEAAAIAGLGAGAGAASGPAIGVFPNANVGGCSVPLLLSCSPSIRSGHIVKTQQPYGEAYRGVDEPATAEHPEAAPRDHMAATNDATHQMHQ
ncbi:uncharacterized protein LOC126367661 [Pectinophora gossypiella]|uniref:uncharacterized protein LOC126367661 n=1 Tax=Pectinophora gossypiella TaxID=13191 RepID=UPI00214F1F84|nr:uncharacterized protein LOC126367661 [Pectinophora gossypiella]